MKELSIEQKAKAYDEALARANEMIKAMTNIGGVAKVDDIQHIFPELKESEDERVRKALINGFNKLDKSAVWYNGITNAQILAWLEKKGNKSTDDLTPQEAMDIAVEKCFEQGEQNTNTYLPSFDEAQGTPIVKQGEQKPDDTNNRFIRMRETKPKDISEFLDRLTTVEQEFLLEHIAKIRELDKEEQKPEGKTALEASKEEKVDNANKVESKFKVGDWVVYDHKAYKVVTLPREGCINLGLKRNGKLEFAPSTYCRPWTIADAKDGDVLVASDSSIFLFKGTIDCACKYYVALTTDGTVKFNEGLEHYWETSTAVHPATKEQRDTLEKAMTDAGYTFDFEKKELKKI